MEKKLYLLDAYALIYRGYYAMMKNPRVNSKGQDTTAIFGFLNTFEEIVKRAEGQPIAVAFDPKGGSFRSEMYEEYKAQREVTPEGISFGIPYIKEIVAAYGVKLFEVPGYEADDVIGTIATQVGEAEPDRMVYMITPDKDYGQLVRPNVRILKPKTGGGGIEEIGEVEVREKYGIKEPSQVRDFLALWGDKSDNVPGVKGIGPKTASTLLTNYDSIEGIYQHIEELTPAQKTNLLKAQEQLELSRQLVTICTDVPLDYHLGDMKPKERDLQKLLEIYETLEFRSKISKLRESLPQSNHAPTPKTLFDQVSMPAPTIESSFKTIETSGAKYHLIEQQEDIEALTQRLSSTGTFAFDTETDGLDAMSCGIVGISFAIEPGEAWYIQLSPLDMEARLQLAPFQPLFANPSILKIGQNIKFDLKVITRYGLKAVGPFWDTMIAHYLIQPELSHGMDAMSEALLGYKPVPIETLIGPNGKNQKNMRQLSGEQIYKYACEDADITLRLYHQLRKEIEEEEQLQELFNQMEMPLMEVLLDMEQTGARVDVRLLTSTVEELNAELTMLDDTIQEMAGIPFNVNSPKEVGKVLFDHLKLKEQAKRTKSGQYVTREEELMKLVYLHPIIENILEYRGLRKLLNTYITPLPELINRQTGRIHTTYQQTATATGRLSSTDPNLQNIPVRDERGRQIRRAFTSLHPERGDLFVSADYSQIELRLMAHFSQDEAMIQAFSHDKDVHTITASHIYHITPSEVTPEQRRKAKTANFGIIYGISTYGLSTRLSIPYTEAEELITGYFRTFPGVKQYMQEIVEKAQERGYVETIMGRRRFLKDINSSNSYVRAFAERTAINAPLQGSAADIIKVAMNRIAERLRNEGLQTKMILQVHDELNFSCPVAEKEQLIAIVREEMEGVCPYLLVPLKIDMGVGTNWLEAH